MNNAPETIYGMYCPHCGRLITVHDLVENTASGGFDVVYTCTVCKKSVTAQMAWDDFDQDDAPPMEICL